ncbi:MAG: putative dhh family domain protein, partial [Gemmatimonadetes bacterium]|nr:putative dhh family domain protein [Gemmatimonadota bacterium]
MHDLARTVAALGAAPSVAVVSHVNPEGDAIGSVLAAVLALRGAGKRAGAFNADPAPPGLQHLPGVAELRREVPRDRPYACYLVLDTADLPRTGGLLDGRPRDAVVLNVDHHPGNTRFGDVNWVEPGASSAGEMVYRLLREMALPVPPDAAANLYAAILTDTGGFRYANTTAESLRVAAELVTAGAVPETIAEGLVANRDPREWRLLSEVLAGLTVTAGGRVAWIEVTAAARQRAGVGLEVTEDFIQYPRNLAGVRLAVAFKEISAGEVRVSLRSHG